MGKVKCQKDLAPKYQQTKLFFTVVKSEHKSENHLHIESAKDQADTNSLERSIKSLNINKRKREDIHDPCVDCKNTDKRVSCTALMDDDTVCTNSYCEDCIDGYRTKSGNDTNDVTESGKPIRHISTDSKWACFVCREICSCKQCLSTSKASNKKKTLPFNPPQSLQPTLNPIELVYPEEEIWLRLQIREILYRFGDIFQFPNKILFSLQNVESDWRVKRLGAHVVWHCLIAFSNPDSTESAHTSEPPITNKAKQMMRKWMKEKKIYAQYVDTESRNNALLNSLIQEGMTLSKWEDIAEILALDGFTDLPPYFAVKSNGMSEMSIDDMEVDRHRVTRQAKRTGRNSHLMPPHDELRMVAMLLEVLLSDNRARLSLIEKNSKQIKELEEELGRVKRVYNRDDLVNKAQRNTVMNKIHDMKRLSGQEEIISIAEMELEIAEAEIRDERIRMESYEIELMNLHLKSKRRMQPIGYDNLGNEYWIFNDMLIYDSSQVSLRNNAPYWAYAIIVVGPGYNEQAENENRWWHISGINQMTKLQKWIKTQSTNINPRIFMTHIQDRIQYLRSLEYVVYGEGHFKN
ncbi:hypothetical protein BDB01DRAFT_830472 [Pilobolus umbonatus]|nr:hypothetical protein BDB01DRAFT_830472 [Pilobolus umbonatus]